MRKPILFCGDILPHEAGFLPKECCRSCHEEMDEGYTNNFDDCDEDTRVDQELCCAIESLWVALSAEQQKEIVERKLERSAAQSRG